MKVQLDTYTPDQIRTIADELDALQQAEGGVRHIEMIVFHLRNGNLPAALGKHKLDADKTVGYPKIGAYLLTVLGCPSHGNLNCNVWPCSRNP